MCSVRPIFARFLMFIVALLQSVLFGISRRKIAPGNWSCHMFVSCSLFARSTDSVYCGVTTVGMVREITPEVRARKLVSPNVCVVGSLCRRECDVCVCALCSTGIRSVYDYDVYCGVITVGMVREIVPEVCARTLVSPEVCVAGSLGHREMCLAVRGLPSFVIHVVVCAFVAARVQFDPGGPTFVTTRASRTPVSAQPQLDVIQCCLSSSRSGWVSILSGAGMFLSAVSVLLRWDFLCIIRTIARCRLRARNGPLYDYACVRSEYTNGHQTVMDEWLFSEACCMWCVVVLICCAGLSDRVFRCTGSHTYSPGVHRGCPG